MINTPMRIMLFFDLPTITDNDKKRYSKFRKNILNLGYFMLQFSVYVRMCENYEDAKNKIKKVKKIIPIEGNIRILTVTDKQYQKMITVLGVKTSWEKDYDINKMVIFI